MALSRVQKTDSCWLWQGVKDGSGYGRFVVPAHRLLYALLVGAIPEGFQIDHKCRVPHCVNPDHLEAVTPQENTVRGLIARGKYNPESRPRVSNPGVGSDWRAKLTHCKNGHPFSGDNLYIRKSNKQRCCRKCQREKIRQFYLRHGGEANYIRRKKAEKSTLQDRG